jgi:serine/threonine protein kinase
VVMEYYPSTLRKFCHDLKASGETIKERQLCLIALQLLKAVQHLNNHKVVHRDIKDDNIFRTSEGILVVADFGCALECGSQVYQKIEDLTNQIGAPQSIAPEVHRAIKDGPARKNPSLLWDILRQNDVYAVGVMLYSILGIRVPNAAAPYESEEIPDLPSTFSAPINKFLRGLVEYDPSVRTTAAAGVRKLSFLLWGPPSHVAASNASVAQWLLERRLDLVFNCVDPEYNSVVGYLGESIWPPVTGIERSACSNYFQNVNIAELMRLQQALSDRKLRPSPYVASVV